MTSVETICIYDALIVLLLTLTKMIDTGDDLRLPLPQVYTSSRRTPGPSTVNPPDRRQGPAPSLNLDLSLPPFHPMSTYRQNARPAPGFSIRPGFPGAFAFGSNKYCPLPLHRVAGTLHCTPHPVTNSLLIDVTNYSIAAGTVHRRDVPVSRPRMKMRRL